MLQTGRMGATFGTLRVRLGRTSAARESRFAVWKRPAYNMPASSHYILHLYLVIAIVR